MADQRHGIGPPAADGASCILVSMPICMRSLRWNLPDDVGEISDFLHLLDQINADVASMTADVRMVARSAIMLLPNVTQTRR